MRFLLEREMTTIMTRRVARNIVIMLVFALMVILFSAAGTYAASASGTGYVNASSGAYLRSSASTSSSKVTLLKDNTKLTISKEVFTSKTSTAATSKWLYVSVNGKNGYIRSDLVDGVSYSAVSGRTTDSLNYRVGAGTSMTRKGTLSKGAAVNVYMTAQAYGSSTPWYKVKVGSSYYYACATWISVSDTIFDKPTGSTPSNPVTPAPAPPEETGSDTGSTGNTPAPSDPVVQDFESYLTSQGFPEEYKVYLRKLHEKHPNWVFVAKNTGIDWNTAVAKESANGVSLVESVQPIAWRATDANSFKAGSGRTIYTSVAATASAGTLANNEKFTILDEYYKGTTLWTHITSASGKTGWISGSITNQTYSTVVPGTLTNDYVNIRKGAGTQNGVIKTLSPNTAVSIVLQAKDSSGVVWYKIKNGTGYAYIHSSYVKVASSATATVTETKTTLSSNYPTAVAGAAVEYRSLPDAAYKKLGTVASGSEVTVLGQVKDGAGKLWLKIYQNDKAVYAPADNFTVTGTAAEAAMPTSIRGTTTEALNYRNAAGTSASRLGTFSKGTTVTVTGAVTSGGTVWYKISYSGKTVYSSSDYIVLSEESAPADSRPVVTTETRTSDAAVKPADLRGTGSIVEGTYIPKDGATWFNANSQTVAYYMDPRNFLNEDRVYMFEDLSYNGAYQTEAVVNKVLAGTALSSNGFLASWFTGAGAQYGMSPVALAARARQETGGGSIAISGYVYNGKTVYNPYNIGATSSANPVMKGIEYAYNNGWYTKKDAVYGGCKFTASSYINKGQNSLYFQRFNVANGAGSVATHQYMTNLLAPYSEAYSVKTTYASYGITNEALTFIIPVYNNMPSSTSLPQ